MAEAGHEQLLRMAGEQRGKVDKTIQPPKGFGAVDYVFYRFQQRWRDEWRRRMGSQAGCEAIAGEWLNSLQRYSERDVRAAVLVCLENTMPPSLSSFVSYVEQAIESRKPVKRDLAYGRQQLESIKKQFSTNSAEVKH
jgi:hypothetical protein